MTGYVVKILKCEAGENPLRRVDDGVKVARLARTSQFGVDRIKGIDYIYNSTLAEFKADLAAAREALANETAAREAERAEYIKNLRSTGYENLSDAELAMERAQYPWIEDVPLALLDEIRHREPQTPYQEPSAERRAYLDAEERVERGQLSREDFEDGIA